LDVSLLAGNFFKGYLRYASESHRMTNMPQPDEILSFWFDRSPNEPGTGAARKVWFSKNPEFDQEVIVRFRAIYNQAAEGKLDHWQETPEGALALILLLDQFSRNMFRDSPQAFATDEKALVVAKGAIARKFDQLLPPVKRWFVYMPLMHSENLADQNQCVELFRSLSDHPDVPGGYTYAEKHRAVIERFGRFPHRNRVLNRATTPEEAEFLKQPGSTF
jgi:uncharacterized protein (DUF924 family)